MKQAVPRFFSPSLWRVSFSEDVCGFLHLKPSYSTSRQSSRATKKQSTILTPSAASVCHVTLALPIIMVPGDFLSSQAVLTSCLILFIFFARLVAFLDLILPSHLSEQLGSQGLLLFYLSPSFSRPRVIHTRPTVTKKEKKRKSFPLFKHYISK